MWINSGDIILIGLRDYQDQKADVILKYLNDEARTLKSMGEIPDTVHLDENNDIEFDANAAVPEDEMASDSDSDMPSSSSEEEESDEESSEEEEEEEKGRNKWDNEKGEKKAGDEGAPFGSHVHYKGEFTGSGNRWSNKKAYKKRK